MKIEDSIIPKIHALMDFSYDEMYGRLSKKYDLSTIDGYLQISYHCN